MATYVYQCEAGLEFEVEQKMTDPKLEVCPVCDNCMPKRLIAGTGSFVLLGGGWSPDGYAIPANIRHASHLVGRKLERK
jgi:putative FmdB family regulatory protein